MLPALSLGLTTAIWCSVFELQKFANYTFKIDASKYIQMQVDGELRHRKDLGQLKERTPDLEHKKKLEELEIKHKIDPIIHVGGDKNWVNVDEAEKYLTQLNTDIKTAQKCSAIYQVSRLLNRQESI